MESQVRVVRLCPGVDGLTPSLHHVKVIVAVVEGGGAVIEGVADVAMVAGVIKGGRGAPRLENVTRPAHVVDQRKEPPPRNCSIPRVVLRRLFFSGMTDCHVSIGTLPRNPIVGM